MGPKFRFLVQKSDFCHTTPILVDDPILALGMTVNFPPWERFFDFPFRSYSCFRKQIRLTCQKVFPLPTVGFYCTVTALALSARRPLGPRAGWIIVFIIIEIVTFLAYSVNTDFPEICPAECSVAHLGMRVIRHCTFCHVISAVMSARRLTVHADRPAQLP